MPLPPTSQAAMLQAIQRFKNGERSPQGPPLGDDWLSKGYHKYIIVQGDEPYPVKEIIRLAVKLHAGDWPGQFWGVADAAARHPRR